MSGIPADQLREMVALVVASGTAGVGRAELIVALGEQLTATATAAAATQPANKDNLREFQMSDGTKVMFICR
jgi:hypothetical protein